MSWSRFMITYVLGMTVGVIAAAHELDVIHPLVRAGIILGLGMVAALCHYHGSSITIKIDKK